MKLDIGAGLTPRPGFMSLDVVAEVHPDICAPMWAVPVPDNSVDELFSTHSLEHIPQERVILTLQEWLRILRPGGKLVLQTPDLIWICKNFLEHPEPNWHLATIYGLQTTPGEYHQTGFTESILRDYLLQAGWTILSFQNIWSHSQNTLEFTCTKPCV